MLKGHKLEKDNELQARLRGVAREDGGASRQRGTREGIDGPKAVASRVPLTERGLPAMRCGLCRAADRADCYFSAAFLLGSSDEFTYVMPQGPTPCSWMMVWPFAIP